MQAPVLGRLALGSLRCLQSTAVESSSLQLLMPQASIVYGSLCGQESALAAQGMRFMSSSCSTQQPRVDRAKLEQEMCSSSADGDAAEIEARKKRVLETYAVS